MATHVINKTVGTQFYAIAQTAAGGLDTSAVIDTGTKLAATVFVHFARDNTSSISTGILVRIEGSAKASGNDQWFPIASVSSLTAVPTSKAVSGTVNAGAVDVAVATTAGIVAGDVVLIKNTTLANSEWGRVKSFVTDVKYTLQDALTNAQTGSTIYNKAELFAFLLDLSAIGRIRLVVDGTLPSTGQTCIVESFMITGDSIS